ncbi:MAG: hypothetical protein PGN13_12635 [Patulibacter minatonensis]
MRRSLPTCSPPFDDRSFRTLMLALAMGVAAVLLVAGEVTPASADPRLATTSSAAPKAPGLPTGVSAKFDRRTVVVRWTASTSGSVEAAVRRRSGRKAEVTTRRFPAGRGAGSIKLRRTSPLPVRSTLRVRLRRCVGSAMRRRCSAWTAWKVPAAPTSSTAGADDDIAGSATPTPTPAPGPGGVVPGGNAPGTTTPLTTAPGEGPTIGGCPQMPSTWALNQRVDGLPLAARSDGYVAFITKGKSLVHPDFGSADLGAGPDGFGIPFRVVPEHTPAVPLVYGGVDQDDIANYRDESDLGDVPIPLDTPIEGGPGADRTADRHVSVVQQGTCMLHELGNARTEGDHWRVSGSYRFNLTTGAPRPVGWTSADAAGLPIEPLLVRYDEAASGRIKHAIRFTARGITNAYIPPASHFAPSSTDPNAPPMGQRFRMKASYDTSRFTGAAKVIATAMKEYGLVLADTGSDWYVTGAPDRRWDEDDLGQLKTIPGTAFEAVDSAPVVRR